MGINTKGTEGSTYSGIPVPDSGEAYIYTAAYTKYTVPETKKRTHTVSETGINF